MNNICMINFEVTLGGVLWMLDVCGDTHAQFSFTQYVNMDRECRLKSIYYIDFSLHSLSMFLKVSLRAYITILRFLLP